MVRRPFLTALTLGVPVRRWWGPAPPPVVVTVLASNMWLHTTALWHVGAGGLVGLYWHYRQAAQLHRGHSRPRQLPPRPQAETSTPPTLGIQSPEKWGEWHQSEKSQKKEMKNRPQTRPTNGWKSGSEISGGQPQILKTHRQLSDVLVQSFRVQKPEPKFRVWREQFPNLLIPTYPSS